MPQKGIDKLIINSPYKEPQLYWSYDRNTRLFSKKDGRRPAGYVIASEMTKSQDDPGVFVEIPLVNKIRPRIKAWREAGYPGVSGITKRLLEHWYDPEERTDNCLFFCQLEAIETLMWLVEAPEADKVGININEDGSPFQRLCSKMATGSGKTIVMAMLIAWQVLNKVAYPQNPNYTKNILIIAPGLTVRNRLQVLIPSYERNYYEEFNVVPGSLREKLRQGRVLVMNWQKLAWESEEQLAKKRIVDKRGTLSDEAYTRAVLGELADARNLLVINDEAHHAWRVSATVKGLKKEEIDQATKWIGGLDRIHKTRNILACYDFSATPFVPSGKKSSEEALFGWIVSDFGLNDAIESGLVKTPRVVIRDDGVPDAHTYKSKLYHIYEYVKEDLNRKAEEYEPLPDLVTNGYYLLGKDWLETANDWQDAHALTPPVMITVCNRTETAARIRQSFLQQKIHIDELCEPDGLLHIDSKVLDKAEAQDETDVPEEQVPGEDEDQPEATHKLTKKENAELLRQMVDTVGRPGKPGANIKNVISVGMLSEGWDARTVTHIMGLRAFTSQLLCEQVVGRGLRRTDYQVNAEDGLFEPEYVNIFGVPFTFLPHESDETSTPKVQKPKYPIEPDTQKQQYELSWPNIIRVDHIYRPVLRLDMEKVKPLELDANDTKLLADLAPVVEGKPDITKIASIDLEEYGRKMRFQKIVFEAARDIYDQMSHTWPGNKYYLLAQVVKMVEQFLATDKIYITPPLFNEDEIRRRVIFTLSMNKIVQHIWEAIRYENTEEITPVFDGERPIRSTGDMRTWYTSKPREYTVRSHINCCVFDSTWEASEAFELDRNPNVAAWAKNDHLGFEILYIFGGVVHKYRPDFLIRLATGDCLVLETKGQDTQQDRTKREFLDEWVKAVNQHGGFGWWKWEVSFSPADIKGILSAP
jgi:type III restriction enzyme